MQWILGALMTWIMPTAMTLAAQKPIDYSSAFSVLEVAGDADEDAIWHAYSRRAAEFHPRTGRRPNMEAFIAVRAAFGILKDQVRKQEHVRLIESGISHVYSHDLEDWVAEVPAPQFILPEPAENASLVILGVRPEDVIGGSHYYFSRLQEILQEAYAHTDTVQALMFYQAADAPAGLLLGRRGNRVMQLGWAGSAAVGAAIGYFYEPWIGVATVAMYPFGLNLVFKAMSIPARWNFHADIKDMAQLAAGLGSGAKVAEGTVMFDVLNELVIKIMGDELSRQPVNATQHLWAFVRRSPEARKGWLLRYMQWRREAADKPGLKKPYWWSAFEDLMRLRKAMWRRVARQMRREALDEHRYALAAMARDAEGVIDELNPRPQWLWRLTAQARYHGQGFCQRLLISWDRFRGRAPGLD